MYQTKAERITEARTSWEGALKAQAALRRTIAQLERKSDTAQGMEYAALAADLELAKAQAEAVRQIERHRWERFRTLADQ